MKFENLFWWQYKPSDEREKALYTKAYSRACKVLVGFVFIGGWLLVGSSFTLSSDLAGLLLLLAVCIAYVAGWSVVKDEELSLQRENRMHGTRLMHRDTPALRSVLPAIGIVMAMYTTVMFAWPTTVVIGTIITFLAVRILLSIGAYSMTAHFEPAVRWFLVIAMPLTAIILGQLKKRGVAPFIGALVLSTMMYAVATAVPFFAIRSIVSPFVITTGAFAPELPNGAYRFVDQRSFAQITVNDYVIIQRDRWIVGHVTAIDGDTYVVQTATTEERVSRAQIKGRVMNETSWVEAFAASQMPQQ